MTTTPYCDEVDSEAESVTLVVFTDNASRVLKFKNGEGGAKATWLRSPDPNRTNYFKTIHADGYLSGDYCAYGYGISWCCCMGVRTV